VERGNLSKTHTTPNRLDPIIVSIGKWGDVPPLGLNPGDGQPIDLWLWRGGFLPKSRKAEVHPRGVLHPKITSPNHSERNRCNSRDGHVRGIAS